MRWSFDRLAGLVELQRSQVVRIPGTAVFLTRNDLGAPPMLVHHLT